MASDKPLGTGLVALGIAGLVVTSQISVRTFNDDPGPKLFPMIGFAILLLCGLGMLVLSKPPADLPKTTRDSVVRGGVMAGLMIVYALGLWIFGYYIATPLMLYAFYHVIAGPERRMPLRGVIYALTVTGLVHLVFAYFLNTLLPTGILF